MTETIRTGDPTVRELPIAPGGDLELRLGANRLRLRTTDGDRVVIRGRTSHDLERDVEITTGEGWIRVTDGPAGSFRVGPITVRSGGHTPDLDIDVPRTVRLSVRTLSGDIDAVGLAGPSRWQSASGTVRLGADAGPVTVETMSGDVLIDAHNPLAVTARTVSGSVKVRAPRISALDVATTSGDVLVDAALDERATHNMTSVSGDLRLVTGSEVSVELQSISGEIRASGPFQVGGARGRRTAVAGAGRVRVAVKTMSGDVKLKVGEPDSAPVTGEPPAQAPRGSSWGDVGRDWAASAIDWASWGTSWAAGMAWGAEGAAARSTPPAPPAQPAAPEAPTAPDAPSAPDPSASGGATLAPSAVVDVEPPAGSAGNEVPAAAQLATSPDQDEVTAPVPAPTHADLEAARLEILRALERGDLDVEAAAERLAALEAVGDAEA